MLSVYSIFWEFEIFGYTIKPIVSDINVGLLFFLSVGAAGIYAPLLAGLASNSKYSLLGAGRACVQLLSFEVVTTLSILPLLMLVGSLSLIDFNNYQAGGVLNWLIFSNHWLINTQMSLQALFCIGLCF